MKFTVILVYPPKMREPGDPLYGYEQPEASYVAWVEASSILRSVGASAAEAIDVARAEAFNAMHPDRRAGRKHTDFFCAGIISGWVPVWSDLNPGMTPSLLTPP
jgi:hypothetical protein